MAPYERYRKILRVLLAVAAPAAAELGAQEARSRVEAPFVEEAPVIDGLLTEPAWRQAAVLDGFVQVRPGDNAPPSRPTTVLVAYDALALYVGVRAGDDPRSVRATLARRDDVLADDHVTVYLDTFDDRRRAYLFAFNPLGIQQDGIWTEGTAPDYSADVLMQSQGRLTEAGYEIEVRIPFRSLRFAAGPGRAWGLHVQRVIKHANDELDSWRPLIRGQASFLGQAGTLRDLTRIDPGRSLELIPALVTSQFGRRVDDWSAAGTTTRRFVEDPLALQASLTAKVNLTSLLAVEATVNPDFAQVEADDLVVTANQRFPLFFPEKRPFFLEGGDLLKTPVPVVDTRRILDPDFAAKLTGKSGANAFALVVASDAAPGRQAESPFAGRNAQAAIARLRRDVGAGSTLGTLLTWRRFPGRENVLASADGRFQLGPATVLNVQGAGSWTRTATTGSGWSPGRAGAGYRVSASRQGRHFTVGVNADGRSPLYAADLGYTAQAAVMNWSVDTRYDSEPRPERTLISWSLLHTGLAQNDWQGRMKYAYTYPGLELAFARQTKLTVRAFADYVRLLEEEFDTVFLGSPQRRTVYSGYSAQVDATPSKAWSGSLAVSHSWNTFDYDFGAGPRYPRVSPAALTDPDAERDPGPAASAYYQGRLEWKPAEALRGSISYTRSRMVRNDTRRLAFDQGLYTLQATVQVSRSGFCRLRADFDSLQSRVHGQVLAGWTPSPGTAVYFGYDDDWRRDGFNPLSGALEPGLVRAGRTLFLKLSYVLRRSL